MKNSLLVDQACLLLLCLAGRWFATVDCRDESADAKRLYGHLMAGYNRLVRPVSDTDVNVSIGLKLLQLTLVSVFSVFHSVSFDFHSIFDEDSRQQCWVSRLTAGHFDWESVSFFCLTVGLGLALLCRLCRLSQSD